MKEGWSIKSFGDCIEKVKATTKLQSSLYKDSGTYPIVSQEKELISGYWDIKEDLFCHSTPLVVFGDHTMVVKYIDFDFVVGADGVKILMPKPFLLPKFFYYWVSSVQIQSRGYARHFRYLKETSVPIPSQSEQQRIVDILDAEFAKIDALKENAEKQLQQTKALLRQQQNVTFTKQQSVPLQSMVEIINGYAFKSEDFDKSHTVKAIKITNVGVGTFVETDDTNLACCHLHDQKDFIAHSGDIVIALTRTIISDGLKVAIVPNSYNQALLNQRVALLRINDDILREYLYYYFQTTEVKKYVLGRVNELMQPNLSIKDLRAMPIPCCEREEMHKCVTNLKYFDELCNTLKSNYTKTIHLCNDLKQALLRKAFNGEL